ncbi:LIM domain-containing protein PLIM2c-like [Aristolochia californica]|uniref:LIM domain-containing protein PLIM2c-like n=1 Tax=Aristolochia californica TaxID=171875 RepID=UPI0035DA3803
MAFTGTLEKCKACDRTVYIVDMLSADGVAYHKTCFKCSHCGGTLVMSNYSSMDGVLYCKPHFEQLFKETGSFSKNFQHGKPSEKSNDLSRQPSKLSSFFSGTQDKCATCQKTAYPLEKVTLEGESYHKSCFKCAHGGCVLTPSSYAAMDGVLYCKAHFAQLFKEKGSYSHVLKATSMKRNSTVVPGESQKEEAAEDESQEAKEAETEEATAEQEHS